MGDSERGHLAARRAQSPRMAARRSSGTARIETGVLEMRSSNGPCGVATGSVAETRPVRSGQPDDGDDDRELAVRDGGARPSSSSRPFSNASRRPRRPIHRDPRSGSRRLLTRARHLSGRAITTFHPHRRSVRASEHRRLRSRRATAGTGGRRVQAPRAHPRRGGRAAWRRSWPGPRVRRRPNRTSR